MKSNKKSNANSKHKSNSRRNEIKWGKYEGQDKSKNKSKRDYTWQLVKLKSEEPKSLTKYGKTYLWCSADTVAPKGKECSKWVYQKLSNCKGLVKKRASKQGKTTDTPSKKLQSHSL